jgi:enamine deaminase RidA (YjgF/YER057c/UK114 family)
MLHRLVALLAVILGLAVSPCSTYAQPADSVQFFGNPDWSISSAVKVPPDRALYWTSGTVPPVVDEDAPADSPARYGDMETQATGILERFASQLAEEGLSLSDVVYLRVYLVPGEDGTIDFQGWFDAYAQFFGTAENPTKPARSTVGVAQLVNPGWRVEIEAFAAYPE